MRMQQDARISNLECNGLFRIGCFLLTVADVGIGKEWDCRKVMDFAVLPWPEKSRTRCTLVADRSN